MYKLEIKTQEQSKQRKQQLKKLRNKYKKHITQAVHMLQYLTGGILAVAAIGRKINNRRIVVVGGYQGLGEQGTVGLQNAEIGNMQIFLVWWNGITCLCCNSSGKKQGK